MSLGVLINLSAVYAENNLNNTTNSLNTVLQQLSSGSKINSGADDAAGLSLVNGLQANQMALNQSKTNATEGVGLLQVADGALSQVTSLLNRAVTLATEASNGTLNGSQDTAANQEYQSILSEVNNIGTTTSFNQETVFGSNTNIYTGDSSASGASINDLNIRSLSSSNVGDTAGAMAYGSSNSGGNVFLDLTGGATGGDIASVNDTLNTTGTTSIVINTLSSSGTTIANTVTAGGTSGFANTAQGLISAINGSGLGVTASFTTAAVAGDTGATAATDTGIMISGSVGSGSSPSVSSFSGVVSAAGNTVAALTAMTGGLTGTAADAVKAGSDIMSGSITLQVGNNASSTVTTAQVATANSEASGAVTVKQLASYITANASLGVTATVDSTTGALDLTTTGSTSALKVSSNLTDNTLTTSTATTESTNYSATSGYGAGITTGAYSATGVVDSSVGSYAGIAASATGATATTTAAGTAATLTITPTHGTTLSGVLTINTTSAANTALGGATGTPITLGIAGVSDTLANLAKTINTMAASDTTANDVSATVVGNVLTLNQVSATSTQIPTMTMSTAAKSDTAQSSTTADSVATGAASTTGGIATISYTDKSGQSLSGTDLSTQTDAQAALTSLNAAISDVSAQDGYIGAQINQLNAASSVLSTQSENVQSAQNAVQATDYASATSNMSKYEILSQTGISALAQANSMQQEVTKLLQ